MASHMVVESGEAQLAVLVSPQNVRHRRTPSRDIEEAPLLHPGSPRFRLSSPALSEELDASPPLTPRSPRPLRALAPAGAAPAAAPAERKLFARACACSRRKALACGVLLLSVYCFFAEWGIGTPAHLACPRVHPASSVDDGAPFLNVSACDGAAPRFRDPVLRLNDVQVLGTHNSYHLAPRPFVLSRAWRYSHAPLAAQLEGGARALELDVHWDPALRVWSVYHEPFVDGRSVCACLADCLAAVAAWSAAHPGHAMLTLVVEPKYNIDARNPFSGGNGAPMRSLQAAMLAALPRRALLTPAAVQGGAPSLRAAVDACGWPSAAETRGAIMLVLDVWDENAAAGDALRALPPRERLFFIRSTAAAPEDVPPDAVVVEPEACGCAFGFDADACTAAFRGLVRAGLIVRASVGTAACAPHEAKARSAAAAAAGVQLMTTDYLDDAALPCGGDASACCVPERASGAPCDLHVLPRTLSQRS